MIEIKDVTKVYETGNTAVRNLNLSIRDGEFIFIVGKSGSGKSTLQKLLTKELEPTSGEIVVNDTPLKALRRRDIPRYRRRLGVVFQDFRLLQDRTVYENVAFAQLIVGAGAKETREHVSEVLRLTGLSSKYKFYPRQLSGGEQQRVAIARAIAKRPDVLLCDEPTGALDITTGVVVLDAIARVNQELGTSTVVITHNAPIAGMAHRVLRLADGRIAEVTVNARRLAASELSW